MSNAHVMSPAEALINMEYFSQFYALTKPI